MYEAFFDYLKKFSSDPLSEDEKALLRQAFIPSKLRKRQYLLQAGNQSKHFAFIVKGSMRMYSVDDKGTEHFVRLGVPMRVSWTRFSADKAVESARFHA